jgi:ubiquitin-conjugating enzyme E2 U
LGARRQNTNISFNQRISFEDYHNTWKGIATSKSSPNEENPLLNQLSLQPRLQAQHLALNANELGMFRFQLNEYIYFFFFQARQLDDRAIQFERLKYGKLASDERGDKLAQISQLSLAENDHRALVVTEANSRVEITANYVNNEQQDDIHIKNDEVDELIEWTQCLPITDETV